MGRCFVEHKNTRPTASYARTEPSSHHRSRSRCDQARRKFPKRRRGPKCVFKQNKNLRRGCCLVKFKYSRGQQHHALEQKRPAIADSEVNDIKQEEGTGKNLDDDNVFPDRIKALEVGRFWLRRYHIRIIDS